MNAMPNNKVEFEFTVEQNASQILNYTESWLHSGEEDA